MAQEIDSQVFGEPMADFELRRLGAGDSADLRRLAVDRRGVLVVFWSGVCSHCTRYDTYLNGFADHHPEIALVAVACRQGESVADLAAVVADRRLTFPILLDSERKVAHRWQVRQTPRVFLLDEDLRLVYRGAIDNFTYPQDPQHRPFLEQEIAALLAGEPSPHRETASYGCPVESVYYQIPKPLTLDND